jgi:hypothetical protein
MKQLAKGSTRREGSKVEYAARFDPDIFRIVVGYAKKHRLSFNRALTVLVWLGAESDQSHRNPTRQSPWCVEPGGHTPNLGVR